MNTLSKQLEKLFCLDKVKVDFLKTINTHKVVIYCLILLLIIGFFIRSYNTLWGPSIIPLSGDDFYHIFLWSGVNGLNEDLNGKNIFKPLSEVFMLSYSDAHPPLRNIILNIILRLTKDLNSTRLVSLIPGLILIPLSFFLGFFLDQNTSKKNGALAGLVLAFLITFSEILIQLSFETRPYMMSLMFIFISTLSVIKFSKSLSAQYIILFLISASLASLSNYPSLSIISVCCFCIFTITTRNFKSLGITLKTLIFTTLSIIALLTIFQVYYLKREGSFSRNSGQAIKQKSFDYVSKHYIKNYKEIPEKLTNYFHFFCKSKNETVNNIASKIFFISYILGLIILTRNKSYLLLSISIFPLVIAIIASMMYLYPLGPTRHCTEFLLSIFIPWVALLLFLFEKMSSTIKFLALTIIFGSLLLVSNPNIDRDYAWIIGDIYGYHQISEKDFIVFLHKLNEIKESGKLIVFDETSYEIVKQKMIILWTELKLKDKDLTFPDSILGNNTNKKFFYCSNANLENEKEFCKEIDLLEQLNSNKKSVVVISWSKLGNSTHKKIVDSLKSNSKYINEKTKLVKLQEKWFISELNS